MNTSVPASPRPRRRLFRRFVLAAVILAVLGLLGLVDLVTTNREVRALRQAVLEVPHLQSQLLAQGSLGPWACATVRSGLRWVNEVPTEAHQALAAVRGVSFAVHRLERTPAPETRAALVEAASTTMRQRGWSQTVAVRDDATSVVVFTRRGGRFEDTLRVAVAVCSDEQIVVAEGRLATSELAQVVAGHWPDIRKL